MKIIPLGTAGFIPAHGRETMSILLIIADVAILLDSGSGIRRLAEKNIKAHLKHVRRLVVMFSHFHLDHIIGLTWLYELWQNQLDLYIPTNPLVEANGIKTITDFSSPPFFAIDIVDWPNIGSITEFSESQFFIDSLQIDVIAQKHAGGSVGFRIGKFAYITDTKPNELHVDFLKECELVFIDTMYDKDDYKTVDAATSYTIQHGYKIGNAKIANDAMVGRLGLIHLNPQYETDRISNLVVETKKVFPRAFIPTERSIYMVN